MPTTAQSLGSIIKSARDIMRKRKGLSLEPLSFSAFELSWFHA